MLLGVSRTENAFKILNMTPLEVVTIQKDCEHTDQKMALFPKQNSFQRNTISTVKYTVTALN